MGRANCERPPTKDKLKENRMNIKQIKHLDKMYRVLKIDSPKKNCHLLTLNSGITISDFFMDMYGIKKSNSYVVIFYKNKTLTFQSCIKCGNLKK